jgi:hypothetical protein
MEFSSWLTSALVFTNQFDDVRSNGAGAGRGPVSCSLVRSHLKKPDIIQRAGTTAIVAPQIVLIHGVIAEIFCKIPPR